MPETLRIGLDIGSTTIKCVVLNEADKIIYSCYKRHLSPVSYTHLKITVPAANDTTIWPASATIW